MKVDCRCAEIDELHGPEAQAYADEHLQILWWRDTTDWLKWPPAPWAERQRIGGFAECRCPVTGWRFFESWNSGREFHALWRRPWTRPEDYLSHGVVRKRAEEVRASHDLIHVTVKDRDRSPEHRAIWEAACKRGKVAREMLYSPDLDELVAAADRSDRRGIEACIVFLEVDPWVFRSGYRKQSICAHLTRAPLTDHDKNRVRAVLMSSLSKGPRREFSAMLRLAHHVRSPGFADELRHLAAGAPDGLRRAATTMLGAVEGSRRSSVKRRRRRRG